MQLEPQHIAAILVSDALADSLSPILENVVSSIDNSDISLLAQDLHTKSCDEIYDVWQSYSPVVEDFDAEQSKGTYSVQICGVPGAYYVRANEYDDEGPFTNLKDARSSVNYNHGEFLV